MMLLADTLSRAYLTETDYSEDEEIDEVFQLCAELQDMDMIESLPISPEKLAEMQRETASDRSLQMLSEVV